ncbi:MAG: type I 3-dehydroquinate dehydratase [Rhabdochlamydiaceae bacterium]|jgi:3-dehydroquinate dehydratase/shikimate dehydrogenase
MLCACSPLPNADLIELDHKDYKTLHDKSGNLCFTDYPWNTYLGGIDPAKLILSYHNFEKTPDNLQKILEGMQRAFPAKFYKIATMARSSLDALRMLDFVRKNPGVIGLCMGDLGKPTRILAPLFGTPIMYTGSLDSALGQVSLDVLLEVYHVRKLHAKTPLYGLIGNPLAQSPGHLYHNMLMKGKGVYCKIPLKNAELSSFFQYARQMPFRGLSVTIPHKEAVLPFLDEIDEEAKQIGAVNTITFRGGKLIGSNTDGRAVLELLGDVKGRKIFILGAGGAARAVAYTLGKAGGKVTIFNRTEERAKKLASEFGCRYGSLETITNNCDILINATPYSIPLSEEGIQPSSIIMDLSLMLEQSRKEKAEYQLIRGLEVYFVQAALQRESWQLL